MIVAYIEFELPRLQEYLESDIRLILFSKLKKDKMFGPILSKYVEDNKALKPPRRFNKKDNYFLFRALIESINVGRPYNKYRAKLTIGKAMVTGSYLGDKVEVVQEDKVLLLEGKDYSLLWNFRYILE